MNSSGSLALVDFLNSPVSPALVDFSCANGRSIATYLNILCSSHSVHDPIAIGRHIDQQDCLWDVSIYLPAQVGR